jgi:hypothetical protein
MNGSSTFTFNNTTNTVGITNLRVNSGNITLGANAGLTSQGANAIAIGFDSGTTTQGANAISIGRNAANTTQGAGAVAIGPNAAHSTQGSAAVAIGANAASFTQGAVAVAVGFQAGFSGQGGNAVAIGSQAGNASQGASAVAIGFVAGESAQASGAVAIGLAAGRSGQLGNAVSIGRGAGNTGQGVGAVAIGFLTANTTQGANSVAIGSQAGTFSLGANSVVIGRLAGFSGTVGNTIILNATGASLNGTTANAFYVKPIREVSSGQILQYNTSSGEISYANSISIAGNITSTTGNINANNFNATSGVYSPYGQFLTGIDIGGLNMQGTSNVPAAASLRESVFQFFNTDVGQAAFQFASYGPNAALQSDTYYRAQGTFTTPTDVIAGDRVKGEKYTVYADSGNTFLNVGTFEVRVTANDGAGNVDVTYILQQNDANSASYHADIDLFKVENDFIVENGNAQFNNDITVNGNINYTRTFGNFTSNATQTNSNVGNAIYMTLNNDEGSNGVSIVSSTEITTARTGNYNIQFSAQLEKTDSGTDEIEIWLEKNGTAIANTATQLTLSGNNDKQVAAWNWLVESANVNDYYEIAWISNDANLQLTAIDSANTLSGVAIPSLIVTVVPVGA